MTLSNGQRITLLTIDSMLAMTHRHQLEVRRVLEPAAAGYQCSRQRVAIVRQRGKRKDQYLDLDGDDILLDGWDVPFVADTEAEGVWAGNACYNLVGDPAAVRECLESRAVRLNDDARSKILVNPAPRTSCDDTGVVILYPELETHHAVIGRMKAARA